MYAPRQIVFLQVRKSCTCLASGQELWPLLEQIDDESAQDDVGDEAIAAQLLARQRRGVWQPVRSTPRQPSFDGRTLVRLPVASDNWVSHVILRAHGPAECSEGSEAGPVEGVD